MEKKELRKGYTTGTHTVASFRSCLDTLLVTNEASITKTNKIDNDDLDVTKGCEIVVNLDFSSKDFLLNPTFQKAHYFESGTNSLEIFAGLGVGVVTKKGLKIQPPYPAINPAPLNAIKEYFDIKTKDMDNLHLKCCVSVTNGQEIAKQTANSKVGVLEGISILGTTGIVKPVSSSAYIDSVKIEIEFAIQNGYNPIYFTLGNSAFKVACEKSNEEGIVEIGNFVYDSINLATTLKAKEVIFLCGIGKMTKVYQGFKNTHNRFGIIDFTQLQLDIKKNLNYEVDIETTLTVKGISQELEKVGLLDAFYEMITKRANEQIKKWFKDSNVKAIILEQKEVLGW
ncbi:cobalamin biosynthesis protein CbiD [Malaciobacter molluscorum LMG 25693]|uniref:Cobalamin biosynthesis protein CbiD n=1 Tax=Malaciobacter molluscorum LMG 25693 TaxID=870501 RepID=A0A2G1DGJ4_9BACT|nr:cobalt-precorrin-5B (C(1))-methyltransferase CbiD [Malaciobacter molluscorum]AXX92513.1 cobalt-precorrin-6A synthase [Malaciobacter molluscorum LMG 25693]PHO17618.1 cobalamin biosynthesis protein CbiD [Malaciobacter molluscorum LMG 25693]